MSRNQYVTRQTRLGICEICKRTFYSNKPTAAYCGNACKQVAYRERLAKKKEDAALQLELFK